MGNWVITITPEIFTINGDYIQLAPVRYELPETMLPPSYNFPRTMQSRIQEGYVATATQSSVTDGMRMAFTVQVANPATPQPTVECATIEVPTTEEKENGTERRTQGSQTHQD